MTTLWQVATPRSESPELAGIFPTYDRESQETAPRPPLKASRSHATGRSAKEAAELARIARAEAAWRDQVAIDQVDEASMESFPCSDPPAYSATHA